MSDEKLRIDVEEELLWEPRVDAVAIAVSANDGEITLRGTVGSLREKLAAMNAAKRVRGVREVRDELQVRILDQYSREDVDLRGSVLQALMLNAAVPPSVDVTVVDGAVTLTGLAAYQFERDEAVSVASKVLGVTSVDDQIELIVPIATVSEVEESIKKALERHARLDAEALSIDSSRGTVTLSGSVGSWAEHDAALAAAWAAPGVCAVRDRLRVVHDTPVP